MTYPEQLKQMSERVLKACQEYPFEIKKTLFDGKVQYIVDEEMLFDLMKNTIPAELLKRMEQPEHEDNPTMGVNSCITDKEFREIKQPSQEHLKEALELLKMAKCPNCDGSGTIVDAIIVTRTRSVLDENGEQIGVPHPETEPELTPCQWCYEKTKALNQK